MKSRYDIIVVGGGPGGASAARAAVRAGARVLLLERDQRPRDRICGEYLCPGAVGELEGLGFADALAGLRPGRLEGMRLFAPSGAEVATRFPDRRPGLSVWRVTFDARLAAASGAEVVRGARVTDVRVDPDAARVSLADGSEIAAALVVGADGRNSVVARRRDLHLPPRTDARAVLHAYVSGVTGCTPCGEMHLPGDGSYVGLNPGPDGLLNVSYVSDLDGLGARPSDGADERLRSVLGSVASLRDRFRASRIEGRVRVLAPLEVRARRVFDDRVLLVGDAAGFLDPLTGEGMYGAIVSGRIAGALAADATRRGATSARALRRYARARRRALGSKTTFNRGLQWLLRRRGVLEHLRRGLQACPEIGDTLIEVIGNVRSPAALAHPVRLLRLLAKGRAA